MSIDIHSDHNRAVAHLLLNPLDVLSCGDEGRCSIFTGFLEFCELSKLSVDILAWYPPAHQSFNESRDFIESISMVDEDSYQNMLEQLNGIWSRTLRFD